MRRGKALGPTPHPSPDFHGIHRGKGLQARTFQKLSDHCSGAGGSWQYAKQQRPVAARMSVDSGRDLEAPPTGFRYLPPRVTAVLTATPYLTERSRERRAIVPLHWAALRPPRAGPLLTGECNPAAELLPGGLAGWAPGAGVVRARRGLTAPPYRPRTLRSGGGETRVLPVSAQKSPSPGSPQGPPSSKRSLLPCSPLCSSPTPAVPPQLSAPSDSLCGCHPDFVSLSLLTRM